jgi:L-lactate utilization protein LutB
MPQMVTERRTSIGKIQQLEEQIKQLQRQWPKHSVPPALMQQLDELEEELEEAKAQLQTNERNESADNS